jgi:hypothetical protein
MIPGFWWRWMAWAGCLAAAWGLHAQAPARGVVSVPEAERVVLDEEAARLFGVMFELINTPGVRHELLPDVAIFHKAVDWALRFDEFQRIGCCSSAWNAPKPCARDGPTG